MKSLYLLIFISISFKAFCQCSAEYYNKFMQYKAVLDSANTGYSHGSYRKAGLAYLKAERILPYYYPDLSANYLKAAKCFSMSGEKAKTYKCLRIYFNRLNKIRNIDCSVLNDSDFRFMREDSLKWIRFTARYQKLKNKYEKHFNNSIGQLINEMAETDNRYRELWSKYYGIDSVSRKKSDSLGELQTKLDSANTVLLLRIIRTYGWPTFSSVGYRSARRAFYIAQHADLKTQEYVLPLLQKAVRKKEALAIDLAYLEDRVLMSQGLPQIYGTQIIETDGNIPHLFPVKNEPGLDERRERLGIQPIALYVKQWDIKYRYK